MCRAKFLALFSSKANPGRQKSPGASKNRLQKGECDLNYTQNYQLNQWEASDRVLREDFNRDNQKIDAVIAAVPYIKIKELTVDTAAATVNLDVSDVDFSHYLKVELFLQCPEYRDSISVQVNHLNSGYAYGATSGGGSGSTNTTSALASFRQYGYGVLLFYTPHLQGKVGCVTITSNGANSFSGEQRIPPITWEELHSFNFSVYQTTFPVGTHIALSGVKK